MQLPQTDYVQIFKEAWSITWKNKFLWWFGFFAVIGGAGGSLNYSFDSDSASENEKEVLRKISEFASAHFEWVIGGIIILFFIFFAFLILGILGRGALLKSVEKISQGRPASYALGFLEGKKYWKKILLLDFLLALFWILIFTVMATPIIFLFFRESFLFGGILLAMAVFLLIPLIFVSVFIKNYGMLYIVLGELKVIAAVERSYELFLQNFSASLLFSLFFIPLGIAATLAMFAAALAIALAFLPFGLVFYFTSGKTEAMVIAGLGIFFLIVIMVFIRSIWEVFAGASWVLFFQKIASPKIEERFEEKVLEKKEDVLSEIEPVKTAELGIEDK